MDMRPGDRAADDRRGDRDRAEGLFFNLGLCRSSIWVCVCEMRMKERDRNERKREVERG